MESNSLYATEGDVFDRVVEKLKEEHNIQVTREEVQDYYETVLEFMRNEIKNKPFASVSFPGLGTAYYYIRGITKRKQKTSNKKEKENYEKVHKNLLQRNQRNQPFLNAFKNFRNFHNTYPINQRQMKKTGYTQEYIVDLTNSSFQ